MTAFFISVFAVYFLFLILLIAGWRITADHTLNQHRYYFLSVIIPFRNEEKNLPTLIDSLRKLNYPKDRFEILLIDDHSTDQSGAVAKQLTGDFPNVKILVASSEGKKSAITQGIRESAGDIIVTTDADCELPDDWLKSINKQFQKQYISMLVGAVRIKSDHTFFSKLQAIEFTSLIGSAAATLKLGFPTMCNGANLSYTKESFLSVNGFEGNEHIASGDDEFLMRKIGKKFGATSLKFLNDQSAIVTTRPQSSLSDFLTQRIRWAGKWRHNSSWSTKVLAFFILMFQVLWVMVLTSLFFQYANTILLLTVVKILMEGFFLYKVSTFMNQRFHWVAFFVLQLIYPFYVLGVGILSRIVGVSWKDRPLPN